MELFVFIVAVVFILPIISLLFNGDDKRTKIERELVRMVTESGGKNVKIESYHRQSFTHRVFIELTYFDQHEMQQRANAIAQYEPHPFKVEFYWKEPFEKWNV